MEQRYDSSGLYPRISDHDRRVLRWLRALRPLFDRKAPLPPAAVEVWRRRLPALIASGEALRYRCAGDESGTAGETAALLTQALVEARSLQGELDRALQGTAVDHRMRDTGRHHGQPLNAATEPVRAMLCRSAARREIEALLRPEETALDLPAKRTLAVAPGRVPGLRGFNVCFFAFLCFQTLVWGGGAAYGTDLAPLLLYALILAPFWWWGAYLFQALALTMSPEQLTLIGHHVRVRRPWPGLGELDLPDDGQHAVHRECWFEINRRPVHCLTLQGTDGRRLRFAVGRPADEHERLMREIEAHLAVAADN
jgi:hypothetical protein